MGGAEPALGFPRQERTQGLRRQLGNCDHLGTRSSLAVVRAMIDNPYGSLSIKTILSPTLEFGSVRRKPRQMSNRRRVWPSRKYLLHAEALIELRPQTACESIARCCASAVRGHAAAAL